MEIPRSSTTDTSAQPPPSKPRYRHRWILMGVIITILVLGVLFLLKDTILPKQLSQKPVTTQPLSEKKTADWKTYTSKKYGFTIQYPSELTILKEGEDGVSIKNIDNDTINSFFNPAPPQWDAYYNSGYYEVTVTIEDNSGKEALTEATLIKKIGTVDKKPIEKTVEGKKTVGMYSENIIGKAEQTGGVYDYYILDGSRIIHLHASSANTKNASLDLLNEILSTFTFTK